MTILAIVVAIVLMNLSHKGDRPVPDGVRKVVFKMLGFAVCMEDNGKYEGGIRAICRECTKRIVQPQVPVVHSVLVESLGWVVSAPQMEIRSVVLPLPGSA